MTNWICPECAKAIPVFLAVTSNEQGHPVYRIDDARIREHLDLHETCRCTWDLIYTHGSKTSIAGRRRPEPGCPVHHDHDRLLAVTIHQIPEENP